MQKVLDPNYSPPSGSEEAEVFHRCNTYLYAVLVQRLKTVKGDELVRLYESSQDAQKVLELLVKHYQDSAAADIRATELFAGITGERIAGLVLFLCGPLTSSRSWNSYVDIFCRIIIADSQQTHIKSPLEIDSDTRC